MKVGRRSIAIQRVTIEIEPIAPRGRAVIEGADHRGGAAQMLEGFAESTAGIVSGRGIQTSVQTVHAGTTGYPPGFVKPGPPLVIEHDVNVAAGCERRTMDDDRAGRGRRCDRVAVMSDWRRSCKGGVSPRYSACNICGRLEHRVRNGLDRAMVAMESYIIGIRREARARVPSDWRKDLEKIEGLTVTGAASPARVQVVASTEAIEHVRRLYDGCYRIESPIEHGTEPNRLTMPDR